MESDSRKKGLQGGKHKGYRPPPAITGRQNKRATRPPGPSKKHGRRKVRPTKSFSSPLPSSAPVLIEAEKEPRPVWRGYLLGLAGVILLLLLGGGHNIYGWSFSLLLPGIALLWHPPKQSPGVWMDRMALAFMAVLLLSFVPQFYWPDPDWRTTAEEIFQIHLPSSLSVQPWAGLEAWVSALAGFAWFYAASSWKINHSGRRWFYFVLSAVVGVMALVLLWGNMIGGKYPGTEDAEVFSFFPNRDQIANVIVLGGVAAFGYAMCALRTRRLLPLVGLLASGFCFLALIRGIAWAGLLLFFFGILSGYVLLLAKGLLSKRIKIGFSFLVLSFGLILASHSQVMERAIDFMASANDRSGSNQLLMAGDTLEMIKSAPLAGHGLGTFGAVFPQYRDLSANHQAVAHPGNDPLWLAAESGVLGLVLLLAFVAAYLIRCRGLSQESGGPYRLVALTVVLIFMLSALVDVPWHQPGTLYFAILFVALALPQAKRQKSAYRPRFWRLCGGCLIVAGMLWGLSGPSGLSRHSSLTAEQYESKVEESIASDDYDNWRLWVDKWIDRRPLDWKAYFQRATLTLSESRELERAAADFRRARFVEPNRGVVALEEGFVWIPYDTDRTLAAWREVFFRELESPEGAFQRMLEAASKNPELMAGLGRLSEFDADYRTYFLNDQSGDYLMQELARDLENNSGLSHFSRKQRTAIVKNWIERGDKVSAESFLEVHESSLERPWWLLSLLRKESAKFEDAVNRIRLAITPPALPETTTGEISYERLKREFSLTPGDIIKGTALLDFYLKQDNFRKISELTRTMVDTQKDAPLYVRYWHAESFFRLGDYIESWYAYEEYLKQLWAE